jgi:hypothetical protein
VRPVATNLSARECASLTVGEGLLCRSELEKHRKTHDPNRSLYACTVPAVLLACICLTVCCSMPAAPRVLRLYVYVLCFSHLLCVAQVSNLNVHVRSKHEGLRSAVLPCLLPNSAVQALCVHVSWLQEGLSSQSVA